MEFRRARLSDIGDIMRAVHEAQAFMKTLNIDQWQDGYPEQTTLEKDIEIGQLYVFDDRGSIAAFAALSLIPEPIYDAIVGAWHTGTPYLTIHRMALDDAHRGGGLASEIIRHAERIARENGCAAIRADTHPGNAAMNRFLQKRGFSYCGEVFYQVRGGNPRRLAYEKAI